MLITLLRQSQTASFKLLNSIWNLRQKWRWLDRDHIKITKISVFALSEVSQIIGLELTSIYDFFLIVCIFRFSTKLGKQISFTSYTFLLMY